MGNIGGDREIAGDIGCIEGYGEHRVHKMDIGRDNGVHVVT